MFTRMLRQCIDKLTFIWYNSSKLTEGRVVIMLRLHQREPESFTDMLLDAEYFASLCGFQYPQTLYNEDNSEGHLPLRAPIQDTSDTASIYGMMVWQNKNYIPTIRFTKQAAEVLITIDNHRQLPYPANQRTEAWLTALHYYLSAKDVKGASVKSVEKEAKQKFIERILT